MHHILEFVNRELKEPIEQRKHFKLTQANTVQDAVKMLANAWNLVSLIVVTNCCLTRQILASHQNA